ncbi:SPOR domain-containing protein [Brumicola nitratireducens]|uniref:DedD protein n=1 Tax=Glaciecola nitratireducens (strain JCM 12485 / KCTC 12276 / FR1064) TaxID=1085623 RepID=G4QL94_GLANF|nr:SPOR domain-containing protein [Glaciecola nitratireducens]AEP29565.1 dedD protein [Glaciecola nitratireducens FR1064]
MSNALQNRLVGTIILVAVTVIFLPDYLDGKKQTNTETFVDFPRSTSNLSATAPDAFPTEDVAKATRREVVVIDEQAADALLEEAQGTQGEAQTPGSSDIEKQTDEERKIAERMANNLKAEASNSAKEVAANSGGTESAAQDNSLAKQTVAKSASNTANDNAGWVVQLGSFGNQKNVNDLLRKLEKAGYRSFSRKVQTSAGRLTKVFVGPELDKEKLELALPHLKETTGLTGKVTTFDVVSN